MLTTSQLKEASELWRMGCSAAAIADAFGVHERCIRGYAQRNRDLFPYRKHHAGWWAERLKGHEHESAAECGRKLGVSGRCVRYWRGRC